MTVQEILSHEPEFQYRMLSRMQQDCKYYLGNGGRHPKHLWALEEKEHIRYMKEIYNHLEEKPEWLSYEEIENYEKEMV